MGTRNKNDAASSAILTLPDGQQITIPVLVDSAGCQFLDIRKLQPITGICTFDPGFGSTASCESSITYIDGLKGELLYRGYPIEDLATQGDFIDCCFLLLHGELPGPKERLAFSREITKHTLVNEQLIQFFRGFRHDAHPMAICTGVVGGLSAFYSELAEVKNPETQLKACMRLIAKMPTLAAMAYKTSIGQPIIYPRNDLGYAENFLHMMFAVPCEKYEVKAEAAKALELIFILHLDHEQNASTTTVRTAGSSQANPFACIASGIAALWGPAHGGANQAVIEMLVEIEKMGGVAAIPRMVEKAKDKSDPFRLMGFGHRVYKTYDPRAVLMRDTAHRVLQARKHTTNNNSNSAAANAALDPLLDIAIELEKNALSDDYFKSRSLYPNVDFYSGMVLTALGIPVEMFTVLFAVARTIGWCAQWREMISEPVSRITRPRQMYMGKMRRKYVPPGDRTGESGMTAMMDGMDLGSSEAGGQQQQQQGQQQGQSSRAAVLSKLVSTHARAYGR